MQQSNGNQDFESNISILYLTNRPNRSNRRKVKGPFYNSTSLMRCSSPMESRTIGSLVNIIHSTDRPNRSNRRKGMGPSAKAIFSVSLANEMQHSNGKLDYRIECKCSPFDKSTESIESTTSCGAFLQRRYFSKSRKWNAALQWKGGLLKSHTQFPHLTNQTKRSNVYDPFSNGVYLTVLDNPLQSWLEPNLQIFELNPVELLLSDHPASSVQLSKSSNYCQSEYCKKSPLLNGGGHLLVVPMRVFLLSLPLLNGHPKFKRRWQTRIRNRLRVIKTIRHTFVMIVLKWLHLHLEINPMVKNNWGTPASIKRPTRMKRPRAPLISQRVAT